MRRRSSLLLASAVSITLFGCSSDTNNASVPSSDDGATDGTTRREAGLPGSDGGGGADGFVLGDAGTDATTVPTDAAPDASPDAGTEAAADAAMDGAAEAAADVSVDAAVGPTDAATDALRDVAPTDVGAADAPPDAATDGAMEAAADAALDSPADAASDSSDGRVAKPIEATKRVLLFSVDGLHQSDLASWIGAHPSSTLAHLAHTGVQYTSAHTTTPSDSFPGLLALVTGGTPKSTGVYYDDSYDRTLYAPGSQCVGSPGTEIVFDESLDNDDSKLFSGGISVASLPLRRDVNGNCHPVFPHDFIEVNTLFEVVRAAGGYTAWSDKHASYDLVNGPSGMGVQDLYTPEINSPIANAGTANGVNLAATQAQCDGTTNSLPLPVTDFQTCEPAVMAYDDIKVQAILNQIDGKLSDGSASAPIPTVFGMNFQQVSVAQKLPVGGYDANGAPRPLVAGALAHVDVSLGRIVTELQAKGLLEQTLVIVTAKHGQSPIDRSKLAMEPGGNGNATVTDPIGFVHAVDPAVDTTVSTYVNPNSGNHYATKGHLQTDDVALLWLQGASATTVSSVLSRMSSNASALFATTLPPGTVFASNIVSGTALAALFGDPAVDPVAFARAPDVVIQPNWGVIYSASGKKSAEHGGGTTDDTGVALLLSLPAFGSGQTVSALVATTQVAPTILQAMKIDPTRLQAVVKEGTAVLPGLF